MSLSFGEKVGLLEEAAADLLFAGMPYVRVVSTYNGELGDRPKLVEALKNLKGDFPLVLLGYTGGPVDVTARPATPNVPLDLLHTGTIEVVSCADDSRAQYKLVRGQEPLTRKGGQALSHRMFSDVLDLLSNRQLTTEIDGEKVILNEGELIPEDVDYIERVTGLTVVSTRFSLTFSYTTQDRSEPPSGEITTINFDMTPERTPGQMEQPPGVHVQPQFRS